jgi:hypothetical protein
MPSRARVFELELVGVEMPSRAARERHSEGALTSEFLLIIKKIYYHALLTRESAKRVGIEQCGKIRKRTRSSGSVVRGFERDKR